MAPKGRPPVKAIKPPVPKYHYKLATVKGSKEASRMETALRNRLSEEGMSFFAIGHEGGSYDVMGDSGSNPLDDANLLNVQALATRLSKAG